MPKSKKISDSRTTIIVAILGLVGVIAGALFANWDKLFPRANNQPTNSNIAAKNSNVPNPSVSVSPANSVNQDSVDPDNKGSSNNEISRTNEGDQQVIQKTTNTTRSKTSKKKRDRSGRVTEEEETTTETQTTTVSFFPVAKMGWVQGGPGDAIHEMPILPYKATFVVDGKESDPINLDHFSPETPAFSNVPCNKKIIFRLYYGYLLVKTPGKVVEKEAILDCRNPKNSIDFGESADSDVK
jgi:hypothetical protein